MLLALGILHKAAAIVASRRVEVVGMSMYPTLAPGEFVLCNRFAYRSSPPSGATWCWLAASWMEATP